MMFLLFVAVMATGTVSAAQEQAQPTQQVSLQDQQPQALNIQDAVQTQQIQDCFQCQPQTHQAMKELTPGHRYKLESASGQGCRILQFIEKAPDPNDPTRLILIHDGPQRDEVLKALIASYQDLQKDYPC